MIFKCDTYCERRMSKRLVCGYAEAMRGKLNRRGEIVGRENIDAPCFIDRLTLSELLLLLGLQGLDQADPDPDTVQRSALALSLDLLL